MPWFALAHHFPLSNSPCRLAYSSDQSANCSTSFLVGACFNWFHLWMGEGDPAHDWNGDDDEPTVYSAASLVALFEKSWHVISSALDRWTPADLERLFSPPASHQAWLRKQGLEGEPPHTRQWIAWYVVAHEIHHGGELPLALDAYGVDGFYTW